MYNSKPIETIKTVKIIRLFENYVDYLNPYEIEDCDKCVKIESIGFLTTLKQNYVGFGKFLLKYSLGEDSAIDNLVSKGYKLVYTSEQKNFILVFMGFGGLFVIMEKDSENSYKPPFVFAFRTSLEFTVLQINFMDRQIFKRRLERLEKPMRHLSSEMLETRLKDSDHQETMTRRKASSSVLINLPMKSGVLESLTQGDHPVITIRRPCFSILDDQIISIPKPYGDENVELTVIVNDFEKVKSIRLRIIFSHPEKNTGYTETFETPEGPCILVHMADVFELNFSNFLRFDGYPFIFKISVM